MENKQLLIDTNVIIDYLKGVSEAVNFLENISNAPAVSVLTIAELYAGARNSELKLMENFLKAFYVINVDVAIAKMGGILRNEYHKSHSVCLTDGILAATAITKNLKLVSLNLKHFPMLQDSIRPY